MPRRSSENRAAACGSSRRVTPRRTSRARGSTVRPPSRAPPRARGCPRRRPRAGQGRAASARAGERRLVGKRLSAARAEELLAGVREVGHVLDRAEHPHPRLDRHLRPRAPRPAARRGCGVVTTSASARGSSWPSEIATSPVPGGMSTTSVSSSPQWTSERNCSSALCSIGPRHITGAFSSRKNPIDISFSRRGRAGRSSCRPQSASGARRACAGSSGRRCPRRAPRPPRRALESA